jgi:hypothetical protein
MCVHSLCHQPATGCGCVVQSVSVMEHMVISARTWRVLSLLSFAGTLTRESAIFGHMYAWLSADAGL